MQKHWFKDKAYFMIIALASLVLLVIGFSAYIIYRDRSLFFQGYLDASKAQVQLLGENASNIFLPVDLMLLSTRWMLSFETASRQISKRTVDFIESETIYLPQISNIIIYGSSGQLVLISDFFMQG